MNLKIAHPQLQIGQNFPQNMTDWQALTPETVAWALGMVEGQHLKPVSNRLPFWPDQYEPPEKLPIPLKKKALQQGYLEVLKLSQKYFPAEFMGDAHQPARQHFTLLLPNEQSVQTTIRTDLARMDQHFAELFASEQLVENNRAVITQVESGVYKLEFARGDTTPWPDFAGNELSLLPRNLNNTMPLNQILYGPPGTGKTYHTIDKALAILEPTLLEKPEVKRDELKTAFDKYQQAGQVAFVTFHQSFSYEDFVEGIRAVTSGEALEYKVEAGVFAKLCEQANCGGRKPFVLIIDEINRGNVSRIFGELITLIEPSKRAGASEALSTTLPYSKQPFSVPDNLYLIGTMNTADRSLAGLDIALRRRFVFEEMPPRPDQFDGVEVEGVNIGALLRVMNQRIEVLLDRDHCLGHAYFMPLKAEPTLARLAATFQHQILPLLQEYFFEDWQHIAWVLNDHRKSKADQFLQAPQTDVVSLFGDQVKVGHHHQRWTLNEGAFARIEAYAGIIEVVAKWAQTKSPMAASPEPELVANR